MNSIVQLKILEENNTKLIIETIYKLKEKICDIDFVKNNILLMDQKTNYIANSTPSSIRKGIATFRMYLYRFLMMNIIKLDLLL